MAPSSFVEGFTLYTHTCGVKTGSVAESYCHLLVCVLESPRMLGVALSQAAIEAAQRASVTSRVRRVEP